MKHPHQSPVVHVHLAFTAIACIAILFSCTSTRTFRDDTNVPEVRVCLDDEHPSARIFFAKDAFLIGEPQKVTVRSDAVYEVRLNDPGRIVVSNGDVVIAEFEDGFRSWYPDLKQRFGFEGNRYSDTLIVAVDGRNLVIVNALPVDTYLESVVPNEIGWNLSENTYEAAEAQAVIARTYAMSRIDLPVKRLFHVYDDTRDQVFTGMMKRTHITSRAVRETAGKVLMDGKKYAESYFHAVCGGRTEPVGGAWPGHAPHQYLKGMADTGPHGDYCRSAGSYRWTEEYTREELEEILKKYIPSATDKFSMSDFSASDKLLDMKITERSSSGRVHELRIYIGTPAKYKEVILKGDAIRRVLRHPDAKRILRSTLFDIASERDQNDWITSVHINGGGNGHGVGMCQWGAIERARNGAGAEEILELYYPGTSVTRIY